MRRIIILLLASICISSLYANQITVEEYDIVIIPTTTTSNEDRENKPRSIVESDIEATYYAGVLTFLFNVDLGNATIVVCNLNTGEEWSGSTDGMGVETIVMSGDEGYYTITIYTDYGEYSGEFSL